MLSSTHPQETYGIGIILKRRHLRRTKSKCRGIASLSHGKGFQASGTSHHQPLGICESMLNDSYYMMGNWLLTKSLHTSTVRPLARIAV